MGIDIEAEPEKPRKPVKRPPNYLSRGVRIRMFTLFAMLLLVIVMMQEARKPENWNWMGFDQPQPIQVDPEVAGAVPSVPLNTGQLPEAIEVPGVVEAETEQRPIQDRVTATDRLSNLMAFGEGDVPVATEQFWRENFKPLKADDQRELFRFLRSVCERIALPEEQVEESSKLVNRLAMRRSEFHNRLEEQMFFLDDDSEKKQTLKTALNESVKFWEEKILPSWKLNLTGEDITLVQHSANQNLRSLLYEIALELVEDKTALNRKDEGTAWLLSWQKAMSRLVEPGIPATHIELTSQPDSFRGERVLVNGWVRMARRINVPVNDLGIDHYYVLWVRPADTNAAPYCVYCLNLPEQFPEIDRQYVEMNERVDIDGVFFKIRSYTAGNDEVATCPLILSNEFVWNPVTAEKEVDAWTPPAWAVISFFIGMPIFASVVAWLAYRGTEPRRFVPGEKTQQKIQKSLVDLKKDPDIKSDLERVQELYGSDYAKVGEGDVDTKVASEE